MGDLKHVGADCVSEGKGRFVEGVYNFENIKLRYLAIVIYIENVEYNLQHELPISHNSYYLRNVFFKSNDFVKVYN